MNDLRPFKPEYFIMCGKDSTGAIYPIAVDSNGNLLSANNKGCYATEAALTTAYPNGIATPSDRCGWFAIVMDTDTVWVWDCYTNAWVDSGAGGLVDSVFGRTGTVTAAASDYDASQVDNDSGVAGATVKAALDQLDSDIASAGFAYDNMQFIIDGGGFAITTGIKFDIVVPFSGTITSVTALADVSGSIVVDLWKDTYANYPPDNADSITAAAPVTITTATKSQDSTLTGWTKPITKGEIIRINVDSCTTITRCLVALAITKT